MIEQKEEAVFDFSDTQKQLAEKRAKSAQRKQAALDSSYIKRRGEILAQSKEKHRANRPEERMKNSWQHNFEQLPLEEQQRIDEASLDQRAALQMAIDTISAISKNDLDKIKPASPDDVYRIVADFVAATGRGTSFSDMPLLADLSAEDFEAATASSPNIRLYGRPNQLPGLIFDLFSESCWNWCRANKTVCNPLVYAELAAKCPEPEQQPAPQPIGLKMATKSEETARETTQEFVKTQQRIMQQGGLNV